LITLDTSVIVAAFASWHDHHDVAVRALGRHPRLPVQAALESYSVLTRLPPPHRAYPQVVVGFLRANFPTPALTISGDETSALLDELVTAGIAGGSTYDALIGAVARSHGAALLTLDRRARLTYERLGVDFELLA
jgi:predicted nucleic acid-binding protein